MDSIGWYISKFFCRGQYRLVNQPFVSVMDNIGLVYHLFLSAVAVDNDDCYVTWFCLSWTILVGIFHRCV